MIIVFQTKACVLLVLTFSDFKSREKKIVCWLGYFLYFALILLLIDIVASVDVEAIFAGLLSVPTLTKWTDPQTPQVGKLSD